MPEFKHRAKLEYRGLVYVYDSHLGAWRLNRSCQPRKGVPRVIEGSGKRWRAGDASGTTPMLALESWREAQVQSHVRKTQQLQQELKAELRLVRELESNLLGFYEPTG